ncbi:ATP-binding protein [Pelomonas sp. SE-A7]|uniref:ATP-binding protein n=1 Tax=Pelomonas sp. SE-A7 TaxID=3054953 RepID=UPI00259CCBA1|nr:ATP-binding protein [Pelomonas sp. SE-A7]MDM4765624.1 ATP-binding protein [Pelomonas sp. SE-A7]
MLDFSSLTHYDWLDTPMWVFDPKAERNLWANAAALSFWQLESAEMFLSRSFQAITEQVRERLAVTAADHAQGKIVREQWTLYPKGQAMTVMLASRGILTPDRRQVMLLAAQSLPHGTDKSMLRGVEALQYTTARIAMFSLRDGQALFLNPAAALAFGVQAEPGALGFADVFASPDLASLVRRHVQSGQSFQAELELNTVEGIRWHSIDARPMRDPVSGDPVLQFNARDINDFRLAQQALTVARETAVAASQAKSSFLANMSHEIRTPMNGVLGLTELVLQGELDERQRKFVQMAHDSAKSLMGLINDLLDVAKIEAGKVAIEQQPFALHDCLRDTTQPLQLQAHEKGLRLAARIQPGVPPYLIGDSLRLRQVLMNLVGNAVKFTERGEVRIEVSRLDDDRPATGNEPVHLSFSVTDTGLGMSREQIGRIFDPFSQGDTSIARRFGGTGLGLTIVQRLVGLMGGRVHVESQPGTGSCFSFEITVLRDAGPAPALPVQAAASAAADPSSDQQDA